MFLIRLTCCKDLETSNDALEGTVAFRAGARLGAFVVVESAYVGVAVALADASVVASNGASTSNSAASGFIIGDPCAYVACAFSAFFIFLFGLP